MVMLNQEVPCHFKPGGSLPLHELSFKDLEWTVILNQEVPCQVPSRSGAHVAESLNYACTLCICIYIYIYIQKRKRTETNKKKTLCVCIYIEREGERYVIIWCVSNNTIRYNHFISTFQMVYRVLYMSKPELWHPTGYIVPLSGRWTNMCSHFANHKTDMIIIIIQTTK